MRLQPLCQTHPEPASHVDVRLVFALLLTVATAASVLDAPPELEPGWEPPFNGKELTGWSPPAAPKAKSVQVACDDVSLDPANPARMKDKMITPVWNGRTVYRDMDVRHGETDKAAFDRLNQENARKPAALRVKLEEKDGRYVGFFGEGGTRSGLDGPDRPGPILLQGDHGPVAYRNLRIRKLDGQPATAPK